MVLHQIKKLHEGQIGKFHFKYRVAESTHFYTEQFLQTNFYHKKSGKILQRHIVRFDCQEVVRHLEKLGEVGEEGWPVPEEAWTRLTFPNNTSDAVKKGVIQ